MLNMSDTVKNDKKIMQLKIREMQSEVKQLSPESQALPPPKKKKRKKGMPKGKPGPRPSDGE